MYLMRGDSPLPEMASNEKQVVRRLGMKAYARTFADYPFEEAFFLANALQVRAEVSLPLMLLGGITRLETMERAMALGFDLVAMGRALIREPDLVARMEKRVAAAGICNACNRCVVEMERDNPRCGSDPDPGRRSHDATGMVVSTHGRHLARPSANGHECIVYDVDREPSTAGAEGSPEPPTSPT